MKATTLTALGLAASGASARWHEADGATIRYSTVSGYFLQDEPTTNPSGFDYVRCRHECPRMDVSVRAD